MQRRLDAFRRSIGLAACAAALLALSAPGFAQIVTFPTVSIDATQQVPPVPSPATGTAVVTLDVGSSLLSWNISFSGLTSPQTAAHFHNGVAGVNGGVAVNIGVGNPAMGSATLTPTQVASLTAGAMYINIHTSMFTGGEIRGQVLPPAAVAMPSGTGCLGVTLAANGLPSVGNGSFGLTISGAAPGSAAYFYPSFGLATNPLSIGNGCFVYLDLASTLALINLGAGPLGPVTVDPSGVAVLPLPLGPGADIVGFAIDVQGVVVGANVATSNALSLTFGF